jgi:Flp pilus assembly protein CpaB
MKRWLVALTALMIGGGVSAVLLVATNPDRETTQVFAAARDVPAGSALTSDAIALERVKVMGSHALFFTRGDEPKLANLHATHELAAGQLIQRSDVAAPSSIPDQRLVFIPVKDAPPVTTGSKVDLLMISGTSDHLSVTPFALGVHVRALASGGLVIVVSSRDASAFVYAASAMQLVAVIAEPGTADGAEVSVSSRDQAVAVAAQP